MFDLLLVSLAVIGFAYAGYKDLRTTEFPDWVPYSIIAAAILVKLAGAFAAGDFSILASSVINGLLLLGIGLIIYFMGSWADGDAYLLGALGFLFPLETGIFNPAYMLPLPLMLVSNVFFIGGIYMLGYALMIGVKNRWVMAHFYRDVRHNAKNLLLAAAALTALVFGIFYFMVNSVGITPSPRLQSIPAGFVIYSMLMLVLWRYVKVIDSKIFVQKIPARKLRYGDILVGSKLLRMPDPAYIRKVRAKGGYVRIKTGVPFGVVFVLALLFTLVYGDVIYYIVLPLFG